MLSTIMISRIRKGFWGKSYNDLPIKSDYRVHDIAFDAIEGGFGSAAGVWQTRPFRWRCPEP
jgi:hypothetical protein